MYSYVQLCTVMYSYVCYVQLCTVMYSYQCLVLYLPRDQFQGLGLQTLIATYFNSLSIYRMQSDSLMMVLMHRNMYGCNKE
jgi:hypothetical protein